MTDLDKARIEKIFNRLIDICAIIFLAFQIMNTILTVMSISEMKYKIVNIVYNVVFTLVMYLLYRKSKKLNNVVKKQPMTIRVIIKKMFVILLWLIGLAMGLYILMFVVVMFIVSI